MQRPRAVLPEGYGEFIMEGIGPTSISPHVLNQEKSKWDAWNKRKGAFWKGAVLGPILLVHLILMMTAGMSKEDAMKAYVELIEKTKS